MQKVQTMLADTLSPLHDANFRTYMLGQSISLIGTWMQNTAQGWLVWQLTGSEQALGVVTALGFAPLFFVAPFAGVMSDRMDRRRVILVTQVMAMLLAFVLATLVQTNLAQFWHVLVIALALGIVGAVDFPAQSAFIGDLAGLSQVRKASALNASMIQLGRMLGPAFAGMLIAVAGLAPAFWINGLSFLAVIATLLIVRAEQVRRPSSGNPLAELAEAVRFVQGQPRIQDLLLCVFLLPMFVISATSLFPSLASEVLKGGPETLGLLNAAGGAGALLGALFTAPQLARMPQVGTAVLGFVLWAGVWLALAGIAASLPLVLICVALLSIALPTIIAGSNGLIQMLAPPHMRARLISLWIMVSFGAQPLGGLWGGFLAERYGVQTTLTVNGLILIGAAALIFLLRPEFRRWKVLEANL